MHKTRCSLIFLICFFFPITWLFGAVATPTLEQKIDKIINRNMQEYGIPGLAIAILQDGKPILLKGYGYANTTLKQPVDKKTLFAIGSISKVITAFAVMKLVQEGKINLDDSVLKYIPLAPKQWQAVTIRQLLSHSSGIPQYQGPHLPWNKLWKFMTNKPMEFNPGTSIRYNNFGYIVLGRVIENASQQSFIEYLNQTIFKPLKMNNTGFPDTLSPQGLAVGYRANPEGAPTVNQNQKPWTQMWSSGGIVSNINDLAKWDAAMSAGQILTPSSYRQLWSPVFLKDGQAAGHDHWSWSLGWQVAFTTDELIVEKNGAIRGYSSWIVRHIDDHLSIIILTNTNKVPLKRIAKQVFKTVIPMPQD